MTKSRASITAIHGWAPDYVLTNAELAEMVDTNDEWIISRTGIKERRILKGEGLGTSDLAIHAVNGALEKSGTKPEEIELLICATVTPDMTFPATANIICDKAGMVNAFGYDINAACSGFLYALNTGAQFIEAGTYKKVMVVGADKMSSIVDYEDRTTCVLFGDAGGAVLLEADEEGFGIQDRILRADGSGKPFLHQKAGGSVRPPSYETIDNREHFVFQEGQSVFKFAVKKMADVAEEIMVRNNLTGDDIAWFVPHQANKRIIDAAAKRMGISDDKVTINIDRYGNTTNATIPMCLWEWEDKMHKGDNIILAAFGGGFTWGSTYIKWALN
jgi:3-oxoacyl-[acyl-carrier-protein] synthase-3